MSRNADPNDPLERWRCDAERQEERFAEQRRHEREQDDQRCADAAAYEASLLRTAHEARIAALEDRIADLEADLLEGARATRYAVETLADQRELISQKTRDELHELKAE